MALGIGRAADEVGAVVASLADDGGAIAARTGAESGWGLQIGRWVGAGFAACAEQGAGHVGEVEGVDGSAARGAVQDLGRCVGKGRGAVVEGQPVLVENAWPSLAADAAFESVEECGDDFVREVALEGPAGCREIELGRVAAAFTFDEYLVEQAHGARVAEVAPENRTGR